MSAAAQDPGSQRVSPVAGDWAILTNHAQVLVCIAQDSGIRLRDIGDRIGITERGVHRIVAELADAGFITREREGRRNRYTINTDLAIPDPIAGEHTIGELLDLIAGAPLAAQPPR